jgi:hypothetical protein
MNERRRVEMYCGPTAVVFAADAPGSACAASVAAQLPSRAAAVSSGTWAPDSCTETQFVLEVLGQSSGFVGAANSTVAVLVERLRRYAYGHTAPMRGFEI